jgi:hypothetical protein
MELLRLPVFVPEKIRMTGHFMVVKRASCVQHFCDSIEKCLMRQIGRQRIISNFELA